MKIKFFYIFCLLFLILIPFSLSDSSDEIEAQVLDNSTVGYYQSTTCEISLFEFLIKNSETDVEIYYNNNNYADVSCFGKITGLDLVNETFFVSIGTNTSINFLLQSCVWLILFLFIPKNDENKKINFRNALFLPFIFIIQYISENRFYDRTNILHSNLLTIDNYYLIGNFLFLFLLVFLFTDLFLKRIYNLTNYIPFVFLLIGTFSGMNLNFYMIVLSYFGLTNVFESKKFNYFDLIYSIFSIVWILNIKENDYFFDGDKLRGFTNTNYNFLSQIFWIVSIYLTIKGLIFLVEESKERFNLDIFKRNTIISSLLILIFGFIGSKFPIFNFYNFYIFGQNKRGMKSFESIAGNTWRGFSSSAESIGEFYAFTILLFFLVAIKKNYFDRNIYTVLLVGAFYGLYRSNNFAATISVLIILSLMYLSKLKIFKNKNKLLILGLIFVLITGFLFYVQEKSYNF